MLVNLKEILEIAEDKQCAIGMFNATGLDSIQAIIKAAEELHQPVILAHAEVHNVYNDIALVAPVMLTAAQNATIPVCVHLDHGTSLEMIRRAIMLGFTSVMIDASALPFQENVRITKEVVQLAHAHHVSVEAELGRLMTPEAGSSESKENLLHPRDFYTNPNEAAVFVKQTGIDALAIAFGTSHGFYHASPVLDFEVVHQVRNATHIPLVMHGGSGVSQKDFVQAIQSGIRKINYYSYMSKAGYEAAKKIIEANQTQYLHDVEFAAMKAMKEDVKKAINVFGMGRSFHD